MGIGGSWKNVKDSEPVGYLGSFACKDDLFAKEPFDAVFMRTWQPR